MTDEQKQPERGITRIGVDGFKSLRGAEIEIRPLTILAGANSSGKSAIMQPLLLMKQTLESPYDAGPLKLDGSNLSVTATGQIFSHFNPPAEDRFSVTLHAGKFGFSVIFGRSGGVPGVSLVANRYFDAGGELEIRPEMSHDEIMALGDNPLLPFRLRRGEGEERWRIMRDNFLLKIEAAPHYSAEALREPIAFVVANTEDLYVPFSDQLGRMLYLSGFRKGGERTYPFTPLTALDLHNLYLRGTFEEYTASILYAWQALQAEHLHILARQVAALKISRRVAVRPVDDTQIEILVGRTLASDQADMVSIADVGFGVSQVLPVLVALLAAQPGQLVYIEQPELHLHPRAQHTLATFIAEAAMRGVRVVIETHSDILLLGVQTLVAKGQLAPESVILHWFERDADGLTKITTREMDADGAYGDWPEDFATTAMQADGEYLDTLAEKRFNKEEV